ncbi:hypothetical protein DITRI_Ditri18aG0025100 [Diplodiscus trichospermus]
MWIDGLLTNMKIADFVWKDRRRKPIIKSGNEKSVDRYINLHLFNEKDRRLYKDMVIGVTTDRREEIQKSPICLGMETNDHIGDMKKRDKFFEVNYNVEIPNKEVEWISPLGGASVCLILSSKEEKYAFLDTVLSIVKRWFEFLGGMEPFHYPKKVQCMDMHGEVNSRFKVLVVVMVHHGEKSFKILVSLEDMEDDQHNFDKVSSSSENKDSCSPSIKMTRKELEFEP